MFFHKVQLFLIIVVWINAILQATSFVLDCIARNLNVYDFGLYTVALVNAIKGGIVLTKGGSIVRMMLIAFSRKWTMPKNLDEKTIIDGNASECR